MIKGKIILKEMLDIYFFLNILTLNIKENYFYFTHQLPQTFQTIYS